MAISVLLIGPFELIPKSPITIAIGLICLGFFQAWALVPSIPEAQRIHSHIQDKEQLNDVVCGLSAAFFAFGEFIGPLLGNLLNNLYGFQNTTYIIAGVCVAFSFLYAVICIELRPHRTKSLDADAKFEKLIPAGRIRSDDVEPEAT